MSIPGLRMHLFICFTSLILSALGAPTPSVSERDQKIFAMFPPELGWNITSAKRKLAEEAKEYGITDDEFLYVCTASPNSFLISEQETKDYLEEKAVWKGRYDDISEVLPGLQADFPKTYQIFKKRIEIFLNNTDKIDDSAQEFLRSAGEAVLEMFDYFSIPAYVVADKIAGPYAELSAVSKAALNRELCFERAAFNVLKIDIFKGL